MPRRPLRLLSLILACPLILITVFAQTQTPRPKSTQEQPRPAESAARTTAKSKLTGAPSKTVSPDLTREPTLYLVGYAHLDTQWRWEYPQVIQEYLTKTMRNNFALFEKYPHYIFNFTGANRYGMLKEYYPSDYAKLKQYIAAGRWFPAGSSMEENDVNSPNAESIIRQILYGNQFYRQEFGKASNEYMLPDCFGFPASLPSILAHAGIKGFSTQKLSSAWQPAARVGGPNSPEKTPDGIPFNVGIWEGPDGRTVIAALNPSSYGSQINSDLTKNNQPLTTSGNQGGYIWDWPRRIDINGNLTGLFADYHYVGTGDVGGSPNENSVRIAEATINKAMVALPSVGQRTPGAQEPVPAPVQVGDGPLNIKWSAADEMFLDILKTGQLDRLPRYKGDLELINHSAGSITSQAYQKRWNRKNELLADAAEKASLGASWLTGLAYPQERLNRAWRLVLGGQFHDLIPGTATPKAFEFAWNDDVVAMNQFSGVLASASSAIVSVMDTQGAGASIVVYNPLNIAREDVVEANINFGNSNPQAVQVTGPDGRGTAAQVVSAENGLTKVLFLAKVPSVGYSVFDVQPATAASASELTVTESSLENSRYRVKVDENGDVSSVFDKQLNQELLSAPIRLAILTDNPRQWPAWNMDFEDEQRAPRTFVGGPAKIRIAENGLARVALEVTREGEDSKFVQIVRLAAGDAGNRVEFSDVIDWRAKQANLKASFVLNASNKLATYNWDVGTIKRPNEDERQFEVASHQWIDLTDTSGRYGTTILTDCKNASDKPADNTLRLTLLRTPGTRGGYADQGTQDWGHHEIAFGLAGHAGSFSDGQTDWQAYRLNQPLIAFESSKHTGGAGKNVSLLKIDNDRVRVLGMKKAESSDELIVRIVEMDGKPQNKVQLRFASNALAAREVDGQEQPLGKATIADGALVTSLTPFQIRSFAVKLTPPRVKAEAVHSVVVPLAYDMSVATSDGRPSEGCFDCSPNNQGSSQGKALPAEMLPREILFSGIRFGLAPAGKPNAVTTQGQEIPLPNGSFNRIYILAAAANGDQKAVFKIGDRTSEITIQDWTGFVGQWDARRWNSKEVQIPPRTPPPGTPPDIAAQMLRPRTRIDQYAEMAGITPGFIKRADIAWFASHRHAADGSNEAYAYSYLFAYGLDVPAGAKTLTMPTNDRIRILAITATNERSNVRPAQPLYDTLEPR